MGKKSEGADLDRLDPYMGLELEDILIRDSNRRPRYHYQFWPTMPRYGIRGEGNGKYLTKGLFWETRGQFPTPHYSLREHELYHHDQGFWLPSGRLIYVFAPNEYEAAQRLVGSWEQWTRLKELSWFEVEWEQWEQERQARSIAQANEALWKKAVLGLDTAAAKEIIRQNGGKVAAVGRPKRSEEKQDPIAPINYDDELEGLGGKTH